MRITNKNKLILTRVIYAISIVIVGHSFWGVAAEQAPITPDTTERKTPGGQTLSTLRFEGASVMPAVWRNLPGQSPELYVLLSREAGGRAKGTYDDWGGKRERGDNHPILTATREFLEEAITRATLDMGFRRIKNYIDHTKDKTFFVVVQEAVGGRGSMATYITLFDPDQINNLIERFYTARQGASEWKYREKDSLALISWTNLANTIRNAPEAEDVFIIAEVIDPTTGQFQKGYIVLRPVLVAKLRSFFKGLPHTYGESEKVLFFKPQNFLKNK